MWDRQVLPSLPCPLPYRTFPYLTSPYLPFLIRPRTGVIHDIEAAFAALDEEAKIPQGSSSTWFTKLAKICDIGPAVSSSSSNGAQSKPGTYQHIYMTGKRATFIVRHYAGDVSYLPLAFLDKNTETLSHDLAELMNSSSIPFVSALFVSDESTQQVGKGKTREKSISGNFMAQLNSLTTMLRASNSHFVRCIKSNDACKPLIFDPELVQRQLLYSGVFEVIQIQQSGLPFRLKQLEFVRRYRCLWVADQRAAGKGSPGAFAVPDLVAYLKNNYELPRMQLGRSLVFYKGGEHRTLEVARNRLLERYAPCIQKWLRMKCLTLCYRRLLAALNTLAEHVKVLDMPKSKASFDVLALVIRQMRGLSGINEVLVLESLRKKKQDEVSLLTAQVVAVAALTNLKSEEQSAAWFDKLRLGIEVAVEPRLKLSAHPVVVEMNALLSRYDEVLAFTIAIRANAAAGTTNLEPAAGSSSQKLSGASGKYGSSSQQPSSTMEGLANLGNYTKHELDKLMGSLNEFKAVIPESSSLLMQVRRQKHAFDVELNEILPKLLAAIYAECVVADSHGNMILGSELNEQSRLDSKSDATTHTPSFKSYGKKLKSIIADLVYENLQSGDCRHLFTDCKSYLYIRDVLLAQKDYKGVILEVRKYVPATKQELEDSAALIGSASSAAAGTAGVVSVHSDSIRQQLVTFSQHAMFKLALVQLTAASSKGLVPASAAGVAPDSSLSVGVVSESDPYMLHNLKRLLTHLRGVSAKSDALELHIAAGTAIFTYRHLYSIEDWTNFEHAVVAAEYMWSAGAEEGHVESLNLLYPDTIAELKNCRWQLKHHQVCQEVCALVGTPTFVYLHSDAKEWQLDKVHQITLSSLPVAHSKYTEPSVSFVLSIVLQLGQCIGALQAAVSARLVAEALPLLISFEEYLSQMNTAAKGHSMNAFGGIETILVEEIRCAQNLINMLIAEDELRATLNDVNASAAFFRAISSSGANGPFDTKTAPKNALRVISSRLGGLRRAIRRLQDGGWLLSATTRTLLAVAGQLKDGLWALQIGTFADASEITAAPGVNAAESVSNISAGLANHTYASRLGLHVQGNPWVSFLQMLKKLSHSDSGIDADGGSMDEGMSHSPSLASTLLGGGDFSLPLKPPVRTNATSSSGLAIDDCVDFAPLVHELTTRAMYVDMSTGVLSAIQAYGSFSHATVVCPASALALVKSVQQQLKDGSFSVSGASGASKANSSEGDQGASENQKASPLELTTQLAACLADICTCVTALQWTEVQAAIERYDVLIRHFKLFEETGGGAISSGTANDESFNMGVALPKAIIDSMQSTVSFVKRLHTFVLAKDALRSILAVPQAQFRHQDPGNSDSGVDVGLPLSSILVLSSLKSETIQSCVDALVNYHSHDPEALYLINFARSLLVAYKAMVLPVGSKGSLNPYDLNDLLTLAMPVEDGDAESITGPTNSSTNVARNSIPAVTVGDGDLAVLEVSSENAYSLCACPDLHTLAGHVALEHGISELFAAAQDDVANLIQLKQHKDTEPWEPDKKGHLGKEFLGVTLMKVRMTKPLSPAISPWLAAVQAYCALRRTVTNGGSFFGSPNAAMLDPTSTIHNQTPKKTTGDETDNEDIPYTSYTNDIVKVALQAEQLGELLDKCTCTAASPAAHKGLKSLLTEQYSLAIDAIIQVTQDKEKDVTRAQCKVTAITKSASAMRSRLRNLLLDEAQELHDDVTMRLISTRVWLRADGLVREKQAEAINEAIAFTAAASTIRAAALLQPLKWLQSADLSGNASTDIAAASSQTEKFTRDPFVCISLDMSLLEKQRVSMQTVLQAYPNAREDIHMLEGLFLLHDVLQVTAAHRIQSDGLDNTDEGGSSGDDDNLAPAEKKRSSSGIDTATVPTITRKSGGRSSSHSYAHTGHFSSNDLKKPLHLFLQVVDGPTALSYSKDHSEVLQEQADMLKRHSLLMQLQVLLHHAETLFFHECCDLVAWDNLLHPQKGDAKQSRSSGSVAVLNTKRRHRATISPAFEGPLPPSIQTSADAAYRLKMLKTHTEIDPLAVFALATDDPLISSKLKMSIQCVLHARDYAFNFNGGMDDKCSQLVEAMVSCQELSSDSIREAVAVWMRDLPTERMSIEDQVVLLKAQWVSKGLRLKTYQLINVDAAFVGRTVLSNRVGCTVYESAVRTAVDRWSANICDIFAKTAIWAHLVSSGGESPQIELIDGSLVVQPYPGDEAAMVSSSQVKSAAEYLHNCLSDVCNPLVMDVLSIREGMQWLERVGATSIAGAKFTAELRVAEMIPVVALLDKHAAKLHIELHKLHTYTAKGAKSEDIGANIKTACNGILFALQQLTNFVQTETHVTEISSENANVPNARNTGFSSIGTSLQTLHTAVAHFSSRLQSHILPYIYADSASENHILVPEALALWAKLPAPTENVLHILQTQSQTTEGQRGQGELLLNLLRQWQSHKYTDVNNLGLTRLLDMQIQSQYKEKIQMQAATLSAVVSRRMGEWTMWDHRARLMLPHLINSYRALLNLQKLILNMQLLATMIRNGSAYTSTEVASLVNELHSVYVTPIQLSVPASTTCVSAYANVVAAIAAVMANKEADVPGGFGNARNGFSANAFAAILQQIAQSSVTATAYGDGTSATPISSFRTALTELSGALLLAHSRFKVEADCRSKLRNTSVLDNYSDRDQGNSKVAVDEAASAAIESALLSTAGITSISTGTGTSTDIDLNINASIVNENVVEIVAVAQSHELLQFVRRVLSGAAMIRSKSGTIVDNESMATQDPSATESVLARSLQILLGNFATDTEKANSGLISSTDPTTQALLLASIAHTMLHRNAKTVLNVTQALQSRALKLLNENTNNNESNEMHKKLLSDVTENESFLLAQSNHMPATARAATTCWTVVRALLLTILQNSAASASNGNLESNGESKESLNSSSASSASVSPLLLSHCRRLLRGASVQQLQLFAELSCVLISVSAIKEFVKAATPVIRTLEDGSTVSSTALLSSPPLLFPSSSPPPGVNHTIAPSAQGASTAPKGRSGALTRHVYELATFAVEAQVQYIAAYNVMAGGSHLEAYTLFSALASAIISRLGTQPGTAAVTGTGLTRRDSETLLPPRIPDWLFSSALLRDGFAAVLTQIYSNLHNCAYTKYQNGLLSALDVTVWRPLVTQLTHTMAENAAHLCAETKQQLQREEDVLISDCDLSSAAYTYTSTLERALSLATTLRRELDDNLLVPCDLAWRSKQILKVRAAVLEYCTAKDIYTNNILLNTVSGLRRKATDAIIQAARSWYNTVEMPESGPGTAEMRCTVAWVLGNDVHTALQKANISYRAEIDAPAEEAKTSTPTGQQVAQFSDSAVEALGNVLSCALADRGFAKADGATAEVRQVTMLLDLHVAFKNGFLWAVPTILQNMDAQFANKEGRSGSSEITRASVVTHGLGLSSEQRDSLDTATKLFSVLVEPIVSSSNEYFRYERAARAGRDGADADADGVATSAGELQTKLAAEESAGLAERTLLQIKSLLEGTALSSAPSAPLEKRQFLGLCLEVLHNNVRENSDLEMLQLSPAVQLSIASLHAVASHALRLWAVDILGHFVNLEDSFPVKYVIPPKIAVNHVMGSAAHALLSMAPTSRHAYETLLLMQMNVYANANAFSGTSLEADDNDQDELEQQNIATASLQCQRRTEGILRSHISPKVHLKFMQFCILSRQKLALIKLSQELSREYNLATFKCANQTDVTLILAKAHARLLSCKVEVQSVFSIEANDAVDSGNYPGTDPSGSRLHKPLLPQSYLEVVMWALKVRSALFQHHWSTFADHEETGQARAEESLTLAQEKDIGRDTCPDEAPQEIALSDLQVANIYELHLELGRAARAHHTLVSAIEHALGTDVVNVRVGSPAGHTASKNPDYASAASATSLSAGTYFPFVNLRELKHHVTVGIATCPIQTPELTGLASLGRLVVSLGESASMNWWLDSDVRKVKAAMLSNSGTYEKSEDRSPILPQPDGLETELAEDQENKKDAIVDVNDVTQENKRVGGSKLASVQSLLRTIRTLEILPPASVSAEINRLKTITSDKYAEYKLTDALQHGQEYLVDNLIGYAETDVSTLHNILQVLGRQDQEAEHDSTKFRSVNTSRSVSRSASPATVSFQNSRGASPFPALEETRNKPGSEGVRAEADARPPVQPVHNAALPLLSIAWSVLHVRQAVKVGDWVTLRSLLDGNADLPSDSAQVTFHPLQTAVLRRYAPLETVREINTLRDLVARNAAMHADIVRALSRHGVQEEVHVSGSADQSTDIRAGIRLNVGQVSVGALLTALKAHKDTPKICYSDTCIWYTGQRIYAIRLCILQHNPSPVSKAVTSKKVTMNDRGSVYTTDDNVAAGVTDYAAPSALRSSDNTGSKPGPTRNPVVYLLTEVENTQLSQLWAGSHHEVHLVRRALQYYQKLDNVRYTICNSGLSMLPEGPKGTLSSSVVTGTITSASAHAKTVKENAHATALAQNVKASAVHACTSVTLGNVQSYEQIQTSHLSNAITSVLPMLRNNKTSPTAMDPTSTVASSDGTGNSSSSTTLTNSATPSAVLFVRCALGLLHLRMSVKANQWRIKETSECLLMCVYNSLITKVGAPTHKAIKIRMLDPFVDIFGHGHNQHGHHGHRGGRRNHGHGHPSSNGDGSAISASLASRRQSVATSEVSSMDSKATDASVEQERISIAPGETGTDFKGSFSDTAKRSIHVTTAIEGVPRASVGAMLLLLTDKDVGTISYAEQEVRTVRDELYDRVLQDIMLRALQFKVPGEEKELKTRVSSSSPVDAGGVNKGKAATSVPFSTPTKEDQGSATSPASPTNPEAAVPLDLALAVVQLIGLPSPRCRKLAHTMLLIRALRHAYCSGQIDRCLSLVGHVGGLMGSGRFDKCALPEIDYVFRSICVENVHMEVHGVLQAQHANNVENASAAAAAVAGDKSSSPVTGSNSNHLALKALGINVLSNPIPVTHMEDQELLHVLRRARSMDMSVAVGSGTTSMNVKDNEKDKIKLTGSADHASTGASQKAGVEQDSLIKVCQVALDVNSAVRSTVVRRIVSACTIAQLTLSKGHHTGRTNKQNHSNPESFASAGAGLIYSKKNSPEMCLAYARLASVLFSAVQRLLVTAVQHREAGLDASRKELHMHALTIQNIRYMLGFPLTGVLGDWARALAEYAQHDLLGAQWAAVEMHMFAAEAQAAKQVEAIQAHEQSLTTKKKTFSFSSLSNSEMKIGDTKAEFDAAAAASESNVYATTGEGDTTNKSGAEAAATAVSFDKQVLATDLWNKLQDQVSEIIDTLAYLIGSDAFAPHSVQLQLLREFSKDIGNANATGPAGGQLAGGVVLLYPGGLFYTQLKELETILETPPFPWTAYIGGAAAVTHAKTRASILLVIATLMQLPLQKAHKSIVFTNDGVQLQRGRHAKNNNSSTGAGAAEYDSGTDSDSDDDEAPQAIPVSRQVLRHLLHLFLTCGKLAPDELIPADVDTAGSAADGAAIPAANLSGIRRVAVIDPTARLNTMSECEANSSDDEKGSATATANTNTKARREGAEVHASVILIRSRGTGTSRGSSSAPTDVYMMLGQLLGLLRGHAGKEPAVLGGRHTPYAHTQAQSKKGHHHHHHNALAEAAEIHLHGHSATQAEAVTALLAGIRVRTRARTRLLKARDLANMSDANVFDYAMKALA